MKNVLNILVNDHCRSNFKGETIFLFVITFLKAIGELRVTYKIFDSNKFI